jgi:hypothetical protein
MSPPVRRPLLLIPLLAAVLAAVGCGRQSTTSTESPSPVVQAPITVSKPTQAPGVLSLATKNTTRLGGADPATDAAAVARTVYPSLTASSHPQAVVLADSSDWASALAASELMAPPLGAPLLYSNGPNLPAVTTQTLTALAPTGANTLGGAQVIEVGQVAAPSGLHAVSIGGSDPYARAAAILHLEATVKPTTPTAVLVVSTASPAYAMPAAGYAALAGVPILLVSATSVPSATRAALSTLPHPRIYVLGPGTVVGQHVVDVLRHYGSVHRVRANDPVSNSIAFASYDDSGFGWNVVQPGHGLVFLNAARPLDAAAAAPLSASGDFGPQLLLQNPAQIPAVLNTYLSGIQPCFEPGVPGYDAVNAVYNHGWVIGDQTAMTPTVQAQIDGLLQTIPKTANSCTAAP